MSLPLTGKRALVTGASRGIGAAIARKLAADGADVALTYEKSAERAEAIADEIRALGRKAVAIQADAGDAAAVKTAVAHAVAELGGLDILVNNAGIGGAGLPFAEDTEAGIDRLLDVNVRGVILTTKAALEHIADGGRIISIGSCLGQRVGMDLVTVYSATKSALESFTRGLAREVGKREITANLVLPGPTDTDMNPADGPWAEAILAGLAIKHFAQPEDIAAAVGFLAGPGARYITGTSILVDNGANA